MGQGIIRQALVNLGGKASKPSLQAELLRLNASPSLQKTLTDRLNKMHKRYEVNFVSEGGVRYYKLEQS